MDRMHIATMVFELRRQSGMSTREAAPRIGISFVHLNRIEKGHSEPSLDVLHRIAVVYGKYLSIKFINKGKNQ